MKKWMLALLAICLMIPVTVLAVDDNKQSIADVRVQQLGVGNQNDYTKGRGLQEKEDDQDGAYDSGYSSGSFGGTGGSYGTTSGFSADSDENAGTFLLFLSLGFFALCIIGFLYKKRMNGRTPGYPRVKFIRPSVSPAVEIQKSDPGFSEAAFLTWAGEVFLTLNEAWTKQDWSMIRPFESEELFREHSQQLEEYKRNGTVNHLEQIAVKDSFLARFYIEGNHEYLVVKMRTSMIDYVMETATGRVTAGDRKTRWRMVHTLTFTRTVGSKTKENPADLHVTNCPNCGAPCKVTSAGECVYCHSVITTGEYNWVLCRFTGENF